MELEIEVSPEARALIPTVVPEVSKGEARVPDFEEGSVADEVVAVVEADGVTTN